MPKRSAGLLMFRRTGPELEVFLVHPGGPFWAGKDAGAWTIPKGEYVDGEEPLAAARREFQEETGFKANGRFIELGVIRQNSGKLVSGWAFEGDCDPQRLVSNFCSIEWPPHSRKMIEIPEVDRGAWFNLPAARGAILKTQQPFLDELAKGLQPA
ncbi:NUDIX domain-containing protein [Telmatobacter sp. DSM 110680]|uniref:NUDIX domain-containing protein n=1 Tax=Telmatobacter sp. DSM 110680 TaxID=3036704 RepID=A0AAU7DE15_9BACT